MAVSVAQAEDSEPGQIGVGYQGIFFGDLINAVSVRFAPAPLGGQIELGQGSVDIDAPGGFGADLDILMIKGKLYYTLIQRENSVFYAGASLGYYKIESTSFPFVGTADTDGFSIAPLIGAEWRFQGLPELGLNFEVSYEINDLESDLPGGGTTDIGLYGITVSTGIHYYF